MKWLVAAGVALVVAFGVGTAFAQEIVYEKHTVVEFGDDTIDGNLSRPDGQYLQSRKQQRHRKLINIRETFRPEILQSVRAL